METDKKRGPFKEFLFEIDETIIPSVEVLAVPGPDQQFCLDNKQKLLLVENNGTIGEMKKKKSERKGLTGILP